MAREVAKGMPRQVLGPREQQQGEARPATRLGPTSVKLQHCKIMMSRSLMRRRQRQRRRAAWQEQRKRVVIRMGRLIS
jgi:hypothetical protein